MQTKSKILILSSAVALLIPALLLAQAAKDHMGMMGMGHGDMVKHIVKQLDLTPDQVQQVKTIFANHKAELTTEVAALKTTRGTLFDAVHADTLDEAAIRAAAAQESQAHVDLALTHAKMLGEVRQVLTPEQQPKLKALLTHVRGLSDKIFSHIQAHLNDPLAGV
jgi:Spy/CpxP family protein refolding chaperone